MPKLYLPQIISRKIKTKTTNISKKLKLPFRWPHPLRKPPRLEGKIQNIGIKKIKK